MDRDHNDEIERRRGEIDQLDAELVRLLNRRARIALELARVKHHLGRAVRDAERERQVLMQVVRENGGPFDARGLQRIFVRIISESRRVEQSEQERRR